MVGRFQDLDWHRQQSSHARERNACWKPSDIDIDPAPNLRFRKRLQSTTPNHGDVEETGGMRGGG